MVGGKLVLEYQIIQISGGIAKMSEDRSYLAPVLGCMIHLMQHLLPEWIDPSHASRVHICDILGKDLRIQLIDELFHLFLDSLPADSDRRQIGKVVRFEHYSGRNSFPTRKPDPLRAHCMY